MKRFNKSLNPKNYIIPFVNNQWGFYNLYLRIVFVSNVVLDIFDVSIQYKVYGTFIGFNFQEEANAITTKARAGHTSLMWKHVNVYINSCLKVQLIKHLHTHPMSYHYQPSSQVKWKKKIESITKLINELFNDTFFL